MDPIVQKKRLTRREASDYLLRIHGIRRKPQTLAKLACEGGGPTFRRDGRRCLYDVKELDEWVDAILTPPMRSTSDAS